MLPLCLLELSSGTDQPVGLHLLSGTWEILCQFLDQIVNDSGATFKNELISALKLWIVPLVGRNEKTLLAPFEPTNKFLYSGQ